MGDEQPSYRFLTARDAIEQFHVASGARCVAVRNGNDELTHERRWNVYMVRDGSEIAQVEPEMVTGWDEDDALQSFCENSVRKLLHCRLPTPSGPSFLFCEGIRGLLWMLDPLALSNLHREYELDVQASFADESALFRWVTTGPISKADLVAILDEVASRYPEVVPFEVRVQISLQIMQAQYTVEGLRFSKRRLALN